MNFLFIRSGGIGDSILSLPVPLRLRELYPEAGMHILGNSNMLAVARLTGLFSSFRSLDEADFSALFAGRGTTPFLRSYFSHFDMVYCFTAGNGEQVILTILASGARACRTLDPRPPKDWDRHIAEYFLTILGRDAGAVRETPLPIAAIDAIRRNDLLVIHPGSGGVPKTWPLERFIAVAEEWHGETVFLLGPAEMERGYAGQIPRYFRVVENPTLPEAASLLSSAGVYLGNDSGASHLAALCRTPSVVLFGPTDPRVWTPLGERITVIISRDRSMEKIRAAEALSAVRNSKRKS